MATPCRKALSCFIAEIDHAKEAAVDVDRARERITTLKNLEAAYPIDSGYCDRVQFDGMRPAWRSTMVKWFAQLSATFPEYAYAPVALAVNYLDRFCAQESCTETVYRLAAVTCFYVACKVEEPKAMRLWEMVELSSKIFSGEEILRMEGRLLEALEWRMHPPSPIEVVHQAAGVFISEQLRPLVAKIACTQIAIALNHIEFLEYGATTLAMAALLTALRTVEDSLLLDNGAHYRKLRDYLAEENYPVRSVVTCADELAVKCALSEEELGFKEHEKLPSINVVTPKNGCSKTICSSDDSGPRVWRVTGDPEAETLLPTRPLHPSSSSSSSMRKSLSSLAAAVAVVNDPAYLSRPEYTKRRPSEVHKVSPPLGPSSMDGDDDDSTLDDSEMSNDYMNYDYDLEQQQPTVKRWKQTVA